MVGRPLCNSGKWPAVAHQEAVRKMAGRGKPGSRAVLKSRRVPLQPKMAGRALCNSGKRPAVAHQERRAMLKSRRVP